MKNTFKKIVSFFLLASVLTTLIACSNDPISGEIPPKIEEKTVLVEDGKSDYKIVVPKAAKANEILAAQEFQNFIELSSTCRLNIVEDDQVTYSDEAKLISIGNTSIRDKFDLDVTLDEVNYTGYAIDVEGVNIGVSGVDNQGIGTLNGAYGLLRELIDYEIYAIDEFYYKKDKKIEFGDIKKVISPAVGYLVEGGPEMVKDGLYAKRLGYVSREESMNSIPSSDRYIAGWHTSLAILPPDMYKEKHPLWYSGESQLCLTAGGNAQERDAMLSEVARVMYEALKSNPDIWNISFSQMDGSGYCSCSFCSEIYSKYSSRSVVWLIACNELTERVDELFAKDGITRDYRINFFVYSSTQDCPVATNADGSYSPIDGLVANDKVMPFICNYPGVDWTKPISDKENQSMAELYKKWAVLAKNISSWDYSCNYTNHLSPYFAQDVLVSGYQFYEDNNVILYYSQGQYLNDNATGFNRYLSWLSASACWDKETTFEEKEQRYFDNYFKDASDVMHKLYMEMKMHMRYLHEQKDLPSIRPSVVNKDYFSKSTLERWIAYIDAAYEKIAYIKDYDEEIYDKLKFRIDLESVTVHYMMIELYGDTYSTAELLDYKTAVKKIILQTGISKLTEGGTIANLFSSWGV